MSEPKIRKREYKTKAGHDRAQRRLGSRVVWTGVSNTRGEVRWQLGVYDLDEFGQPPVFECPYCGREMDE